jgi:hypothetical protein
MFSDGFAILNQYKFPSEELARQNWLQPVFRAEQVQVYQVTGCPQP